MKNKILPGVMTALALAFALPYQAQAIDKGSTDPTTLNETDLLAQVRQLTTEKFELTQFAAGKASKDRVKQFAQRTLQHAQETDTKLNDLAATGSVTAADKDAPTGGDEVSAVEQTKGEIDVPYLKAMLDMDNLLIPLYEQLAARAGNPKLKEFARESLAGDRTQIKDLQDLQ